MPGRVSPGGAAAGRPSYGRDYFEAVYRDYAAQNPANKLDEYVRLAEEAARGIPEPSLLEVGCGPGFFLAALGSRWKRCATDVSDWAAAEAKRRSPESSVEVAPAERIPFDGPFDVAVAFDVLEHLPDPEAAVRSVAAKLRPGGVFLFVVPVYDGPVGPVVRLLDRDPTHLQKRGRRFWLELAGRSLALEDWWGVFRYLMPWGLYVHRPTRGLRQVAPAIVVRCRRRP